MSRRQVNPQRQPSQIGSIIFSGKLHQKSRQPFTAFFAAILGVFLLIGYFYNRRGSDTSNKEAVSKSEGGVSCTLEVPNMLPFLKKAYGNSTKRLLHIGPDTCSVLSKFLKVDNTEAFGIDPYNLNEATSYCKNLVKKGIMRVADIKYPLPYKERSFPLVIISDALDYLSPKYLNRTLLELARVSKHGFVIFTGYPGQRRIKTAELSKFGRLAKLRSSSWWIRYFVQSGLEENETATKKFEQTLAKRSYKSPCQIFHLKPRT